MKKFLLGLAIPFAFVSVAGAKGLHRGFINVRPQTSATAHTISGRTEKGAAVQVLQGKHVLATGKADHYGDFNIRIKSVMPVGYKYYVVSSKHGYKIAKKGFTTYRVAPTTTPTTPVKRYTPVATNSSSTSSSSSTPATNQSSPKVTSSSVAPNNTTDTSGHQNGDAWFVMNGTQTTAIYTFSNGSWQLENSSSQYTSSSTPSTNSTPADTSELTSDQKLAQIQADNQKIDTIGDEADDMSANVKALTTYGQNDIDNLKKQDTVLLQNIQDSKGSNDPTILNNVKEWQSTLQEHKNIYSEYSTALLAANGDISGYIKSYNNLVNQVSSLQAEVDNLTKSFGN